MKRSLAFLLLTATVFACVQSGNEQDAGVEAATASVPDIVDFNYHVKPILSDKCFICHGPDENKRESGLALHERDLALLALGEAQDRHAIVPGDTARSHLVQRIHTADPAAIMPPPESNLTLSKYEKEVLTRWVAQGADYKRHWSFIAPVKPEVPEAGAGWASNAIDAFIARGHDQAGFAPAPAADKATLLRRASFALTGLPPSTEELDRFLSNESPNAFEAEVDRLLASSAYAERMAQIWMDVARYGDSHGYQDDPERFMWPWRDWVIHAYQENLPYDDFVTWQLAGDLLPDAGLEQIVATGFNRNHKITYEGGSLDEEFRTEYVADRAQVAGTAFLGLTVECARCHDHKYDPISQRNYFELFAFFNNVDEEGFIEPVGRTPDPFITVTDAEIEEVLHFIHKPDSIEQVELMVMQEMPKPRQAYILDRGQYDQPTLPVQPSTPERILPFSEYPENRLGLAQWLFDPSHPLTARVAVNRLWQQVFGEGLVATSYDFGNQGSLPSHPELLDYLALRFQEEAWDTRAMLQLMVLSSTFGQSARPSEKALLEDPENRMLSSAPRVRLEAEMVRDNALCASGLLNTQIGGPSVKPYQPGGLWAEKIGGGGDLREYIQDSGEQLYRRSLYTFWKRTVPPPGMLTFDASTRDQCTVKRQETNTPMQALVMLNDPQMLEASRVLATRVLLDETLDNRGKLNALFRSLTSRFADAAELDVLEQQLTSVLEAFENDEASASALIHTGESEVDATLEVHVLAAFTLVANTIMNLDEALNRG